MINRFFIFKRYQGSFKTADIGLTYLPGDAMASKAVTEGNDSQIIFQYLYER